MAVKNPEGAFNGFESNATDRFKLTAYEITSKLPNNEWFHVILH
jgi:hypothetical protein